MSEKHIGKVIRSLARCWTSQFKSVASCRAAQRREIDNHGWLVVEVAQLTGDNVALHCRGQHRWSGARHRCRGHPASPSRCP